MAPLPVSTEQAERDRPLSFHWRTIDYEHISALGVSHHRDRDRNAARNSILTEAVRAHAEGRWVSYSTIPFARRSPKPPTDSRTRRPKCRAPSP